MSPFDSSTLTDALFTVAAFTASLNVTVTALVTATFVAPLAGVIPVTLNGPLSTTVELNVVNPLLNAGTAFPARSVIPPSVTVYAVFTASVLVGVNVTTFPPVTLTVPATPTLPAIN